MWPQFSSHCPGEVVQGSLWHTVRRKIRWSLNGGHTGSVHNASSLPPFNHTLCHDLQEKIIYTPSQVYVCSLIVFISTGKLFEIWKYKEEKEKRETMHDKRLRQDLSWYCVHRVLINTLGGAHPDNKCLRKPSHLWYIGNSLDVDAICSIRRKLHIRQSV